MDNALQTDMVPISDHPSPDYVRVYQWGAARSLVTVPEAAEALGLTEVAVAQAIRALVEVRLLVSAPTPAGATGAEPAWRALHPQIAAACLASTEAKLRRRLFEIDSRRDALDVVSASCAAHDDGERRVPATVEPVADPGDLAALLEQAAAECTAEVMASRPLKDCTAPALQPTPASDVALLKRGVRLRTLYQHAARYDQATQVYAERIAGCGAEVRTLPEVLGLAVVYDRRVAFIPCAEPGGVATVIRDPSVVALLCQAFDRGWDHGVPYPAASVAPRAVGDELRRCILRLLSQGMKDDAIARRLGISLRTCRKHIAGIFSAVDAKSRFQAGYLTAVQNLLPGTAVAAGGALPERGALPDHGGEVSDPFTRGL